MATVKLVIASTVPPLISKAEPSISEDPAVNLPPSVKALIVVGATVLTVKVFEVALYSNPASAERTPAVPV